MNALLKRSVRQRGRIEWNAEKISTKDDCSLGVPLTLPASMHAAGNGRRFYAHNKYNETARKSAYKRRDDNDSWNYRGWVGARAWRVYAWVRVWVGYECVHLYDSVFWWFVFCVRGGGTAASQPTRVQLQRPDGEEEGG